MATEPEPFELLTEEAVMKNIQSYAYWTERADTVGSAMAKSNRDMYEKIVREEIKALIKAAKPKKEEGA